MEACARRGGSENWETEKGETEQRPQKQGFPALSLKDSDQEARHSVAAGPRTHLKKQRHNSETHRQPRNGHGRMLATHKQLTAPSQLCRSGGTQICHMRNLLNYQKLTVISLREEYFWDAWVAHSVKRPTLVQVMISQTVRSSPALGSVLTAWSLEPASDSVSPFLSLSAPPCPSWAD